MSRTQKWLGGTAVFIIVAAVAIHFFDWNLLRPYVARKVTAATGRTFAINGDLDVRLSLTPRIRADGVVLGNADWSKTPNMAELERVEFSIRLLPLLRGDVVLPDVALSKPRFVLEVNSDGTPNWKFDTQKQDDTSPRELPMIGSIAVDNGTVVYRDPTQKSDLTLSMETVDDAAGRTVAIKGRGTFKGLASTIDARAGQLLALRDETKPYPIDARATLGSTKVTAKGTLTDPLRLSGQDIDFTLEGNDLAQLYPIVGVPLPPTPRYKVAARLTHTGGLWTLKGIKGIVGDSDLAGDFSVDRSVTPQFIKADLVSNKLDMEDLGGFIGAERGDAPPAKAPPAGRVLPNEPYSIEKLQAANVDVRFRGARIVTEKIPLEKMDVHMLVKNGAVELSPLNFSVAGGTLESRIRMDAKSKPIASHAEIVAKGLHLDRLMPTAKMSEMAAGTMGGRAKLAMSGNSIAQMLGSANGEAALIMNGGSISELAMRLSNLDIANSLARLIGGDRQTPIRCFVSNWNAKAGNFEVQAMVLETPKVNLNGTGNVNLKDETLNLRLAADSKTFSLASLRGPIDIGGTLDNPTIRPDLGRAAARGGGAVVAGLLTGGIATLLPLLEFGKPEESHCHALKTEARADVGVKSSDLQSRSGGGGRK